MFLKTKVQIFNDSQSAVLIQKEKNKDWTMFYQERLLCMILKLRHVEDVKYLFA